MRPLNPTDGFTMHAWMVTELNLSCYELVAYAIVHQFSQSRAGLYTGGVPYLSAWMNCSDVTARKHLHNLEKKGLIKSERGTKEGVPFCNYQVIDNHIPKNLEGTPKNLMPYPQKSLGYTPKNLTVDNNIDNNINNNNNPLYPPKGGAFRIPTIDEIKNYCRERNNDVDAEAFYAFYTSKGWKVGSQPMKDWKAAVITWEKRNSTTSHSLQKEKYLTDDFKKYYQ